MKKEPKVKLPKGVTEEFVSTLDAASDDSKRTLIIQMQKGLDEAQTFLKTNEAIQNLREQLKMIEEPSREAIKVLRNRTKYVIDLLNKTGAI